MTLQDFLTQSINGNMAIQESKKDEKFHQIFYHGANEIYPTGLRPISQNMGNKWEPAKWVTYMWTKRDYAIVFSILRKWYDLDEDPKMLDIKNKHQLRNPLIDLDTYKLVFVDKQCEMCKKVLKGSCCYVYSFQVDPKSIGVGHSSGLDEYTSTDPNPRVLNIEEIPITAKLFDQYVKPVSLEEYKHIKETLSDHKRELFSGLMYDQDTVFKRNKYIHMKRYWDSVDHTVNLQTIVDQCDKYNELYSKFKELEDFIRFFYTLESSPVNDSTDRFFYPEEVLKNKKGDDFDVAFTAIQYFNCIKRYNMISIVGFTYTIGSSKREHVCFRLFPCYQDKEGWWSILPIDGPKNLKGKTFKGNTSLQDTIDLFSKAYLDYFLKKSISEIGNNITIKSTFTRYIKDRSRLGDLEKKYFFKDKKAIPNKIKVVLKLFD